MKISHSYAQSRLIVQLIKKRITTIKEKYGDDPTNIDDMFNELIEKHELNMQIEELISLILKHRKLNKD